MGHPFAFTADANTLLPLVSFIQNRIFKKSDEKFCATLLEWWAWGELNPFLSSLYLEALWTTELKPTLHKTKEQSLQLWSGEPDRFLTCNFFLAKEVLSQLSYELTTWWWHFSFLVRKPPLGRIPLYAFAQVDATIT